MQCPLYDDYRSTIFIYISELLPRFTDYDEYQQFIWLMFNLNIGVLSEFTFIVKQLSIYRKETTEYLQAILFKRLIKR